jgi:hypothetical protein
MLFAEFFNKNIKDVTTLGAVISMTKQIEEITPWHPENSLYDHISMVFNRLSKKYNDLNLNLSAIFHDLGKIPTIKYDEKNDKTTAFGHDIESLKYIDDYQNWINSMGGNVDIIKFVVKNHMRFKYFDEMKYKKQMELVNNPYFKYLLKFETADYGGYSIDCKPMKNIKIKKNRKYVDLQGFLNNFYIKGWILLPLNNYYVLKTKKTLCC